LYTGNIVVEYGCWTWQDYAG